MKKVEVIKQFTLKDFSKLKEIERKDKEEYGKLFVGDKFKCDDEMAKYLTGGNSQNEVVVKVIEDISETKVENKNVQPKKESKTNKAKVK